MYWIPRLRSAGKGGGAEAQHFNGNRCELQAERARVIHSSECAARDWLVVYTNTFSSIQLPVPKVTCGLIGLEFPHQTGVSALPFRDGSSAHVNSHPDRAGAGGWMMKT